MNIVYVFIALAVIIGLIWLGFFQQRVIHRIRGGKPYNDLDEDSRLQITGLKWGRGASWLVALILVVVFINNFVVRIPNPFEVPRASLDGLATRTVSSPKGPLTVPATNADPAAATQHEQDLLEQAKKQQPQNLNK